MGLDPRHFGVDYKFGSVFFDRFQNAASLFALASFAAVSAPQRPGREPSTYAYTAKYNRDVGRLIGSGAPTSLYTLVVIDTFTVNRFGRRVYDAFTMYPGR